MNKLILLAIFSIFFLALSLSQNWYYCGSPLSPFQNCQVINNFTSPIYGGQETCAKLSFENKANLKFPLVVRINYTAPEGYEIWGNEFRGYGFLYSSLGGYNRSLTCTQPEIISFFAENYTVPNNTLYCYNNEDLFIVGPKSDNTLTICLIPDIRIIPTHFEFTIELLSTYGPVWAEPKNVTINGYTAIPQANLEIFTNFSDPVEFDALLYGSIFIPKVPPERPLGIAFLEIKSNATQEQLNNGVKIRIHYDESWISLRGLDESNIRIYRFDEENLTWIEINSIVNTSENYVESAWLKKLGLFGLFTSYPINQIVREYRYTTENILPPIETLRIVNVTQNITYEKPVERIVEKVVTEKAQCGNNICEATENCQICPQDCKCPEGYDCINGICIAKPICGNGICEKGENANNCPEDCAVVAPSFTARFIDAITNPAFALIIGWLLLLTFLTFKKEILKIFKSK